MTHENQPTPAEHDQDQLLDHEYDGIQEYDNPLPLWWKAIFWGTIFFAPLYILFYHFGPGMLSTDSYDAAMVAFYDEQAKELLALGEITDTTLDGLRSNESMMANAKKVYAARCATCHGVFSEGGIGPNLTDEYWLHGNRLTEIYQTIVKGVPEKGMLAWERQLRPAELMGMAAYVGSLQGANPPNPKEPQGDRLDPSAMVVAAEGGTAPAEGPEIAGVDEVSEQVQAVP